MVILAVVASALSVVTVTKDYIQGSWLRIVCMSHN